MKNIDRTDGLLNWLINHCGVHMGGIRLSCNPLLQLCLEGAGFFQQQRTSEHISGKLTENNA